MKIFKKEIPNKVVLKEIYKIFIILISCFILAIGSGLFYSPLNIVAGGVTGIAIIINSFIDPSNGIYLDIIIYIMEAVLIVISFIFLGKKVTFKSLIACICYPLFLSLILRVPFFQQLADYFNISKLGDSATAEILLGGILGGALSGIAIAMAFSVGGSTGGTDTIILIIKKYFKQFKESTISFALDALIILIGMIICWQNTKNYYVTCAVDILSALTCALVIEGVYIMRNSSVIIEVVSEKWEEINNYIQNDLERGSTIYDAQGGYQFANKRVIKVVINKKEYDDVLKKIMSIDENAFITCTISKVVLGNGFSKNNPFD